MTGRVSPGTQRRYSLSMICAVYRVPRSSVYAAGGPARSPTRGNKPAYQPRSRCKAQAGMRRSKMTTTLSDIRSSLSAAQQRVVRCIPQIAKFNDNGITLGG
jgi:hypothetical protein